MARVKKGNQRITTRVSYGDVNTGREYTPFISRVSQQNIREGELAGRKSKFVRAAPTVSGNPVTLVANEPATIVITLTANDANVIIAWPQINIYLSSTGGNRDDLWFSGDNVSSADALLQIGFTQQIGTQSTSGLASNQARVEGEMVNRDSSTHTYSIHVRWLYFILE